MNWRVDISQNAAKFLASNELTIDEVKNLASKAIRYLQGENVNIDMKKLKGEWRGFYRIRSGKVRIIAEFHFEDSVVFIEAIDWRGGVYK